MGVLQNFQKFGLLWHGRKELTEVPGGCQRCCNRTPGIVARGAQNARKFGYGYESLTELPELPGILARAYRTYRSSGYGYERPTELTEVPGRGNTRVNAHPIGEVSSIRSGVFNPTCKDGMFLLGQCFRTNLS